MSAHRLEIQESPPVTPFLVLSIALHIGVGLLVTLMIALGMMPEQEVTETKHPPVKVKYVPPEKKRLRRNLRILPNHVKLKHRKVPN